ncbi:ATP-binding cassette domain-containing protein [Streptomyces sp. WMMC897]|uniref:ATP-binding cassette domain-containing protein n=1 Tax=Streptomyces sp. WMMC897 TaxID=3014782 RepID=UPI0022B71D13|nr:ATP-binding cassette domain-containing protein [Streptomyces sp. WMMC897]MCZ7416108.1 ATP-binding cassette domain-containing protein [Streptomyces sp. WMMC897]
MIQAIGLTSDPCRGRPAVVDDLTFEARPGRITTLLGPTGAGKSTALRLMLQLQGGRGVALFRGRPLHQVRQPAHEVGVLLGDVPGHPGRTARGHLRMLAAVAGVPADRADELLDVVGLSGLADQRLAAFSLGMDRRLGLAAALLGDPHTLVLDDPAQGLTAREVAWLHNLLRGYAEQGGLVLTTTRDPKEAARIADRVVTIEGGRLLADQEADDFARTRLRPRVVVTSPHARRLAAVLVQEARSAAWAGGLTAQRSGTAHPRPAPAARPRPVASAADTGTVQPVEVVEESGGRISVYGSTCAMVGEIAYRHGILVHQLADEVGDTGSRAAPPLERADGRRGDHRPGHGGHAAPRGTGAVWGRAATGTQGAGASPRVPTVAPPGPCRPLRYELRRLSGIRSTWLLLGGTLLAGLMAALVLGHQADASGGRVLTGWPDILPLPPLAAAAGLLGALSFGQEFRFPALAPAQAPVPRRLGLLGAKLAVSSAVALLFTLAAVLVNATALTACYGTGFLALPPHWALDVGATACLAVGCAWAGVLAAAVFRSTILGTAAVVAVPLALAPAVRRLLADGNLDTVTALSQRLEPLILLRWPGGAESWAPTAARLLSQPVSGALAVSLAALFFAYACTTLYGRAR